MLQKYALLLYCDCQSQGQLLGRGLCLSISPLPLFFKCHFYLCPQFPVLFPLNLDSSSELPAALFMTCCVTCLFFSCPSFCGVAVIKPYCLVFRGPSAAVRLLPDALYIFVVSLPLSFNTLEAMLQYVLGEIECCCGCCSSLRAVAVSLESSLSRQEVKVKAAKRATKRNNLT